MRDVSAGVPPLQDITAHYSQTLGNGPAALGSYVVVVFDGPLQGEVDDITLALPRTPDNDADVQAIVAALQRIAARLAARRG